ncbi:MAG: class I SAM-dependent methyltransferase [Deltaproteobacteria bacterium]|nr:class I SAM-dependent methyltransferase [Deltaproteobacteria bacterium]
MTRHRPWFFAGLLLTALSTLTLEVLNTRLLSVLVWYHLSFFAVSVAMLGMAAGAVAVYLGGRRFEGEAAKSALSRYALLFAISIPLSHAFNLSIPIMDAVTTNGVLSLSLCTIALSVPFYLSGIVITVSLTRGPGPIGMVYAVDLFGAALGSLLLMPLLRLNSITSAIVMSGALASLGACFFALHAGRRWVASCSLAAVMVAAALGNAYAARPIRLIFQKGEYHAAHTMAQEYWTVHGQVVRYQGGRGGPPFWSTNAVANRTYPQVGVTALLVDGHAGTVMTEWDGKRESLEWTTWDVTSLPYHIRRGGNVAVIGVGGGRDLLTAVYAGSGSIHGIEINRAFTEILTNSHRDYAKIADHPGVALIHDEARSFLTRSSNRYDVIQMSLVDTWAATGAGAFTLTENGLYTVEAWEIFLKRLRPGGVLSISRFFAEQRASETSRLVSVATAALLGLGIQKPYDHIVLIANRNVATLMVSNEPFSSLDLLILQRSVTQNGFRFLMAPGVPTAVPLLERIARSRSPAEIHEVVRKEPFDYTPTTDERPYFFNLLKPFEPIAVDKIREQYGVISGNLMATITLGVLLLVVFVLVLLVIFGPLLRSGLPKLKASSFWLGVLYFALIGAGFMLIQIGLMQRFSLYLGHPTYAVVVVLFSMILATGVGSFISDRLDVNGRMFWPLALPVTTVAVLLFIALFLQPVTTGTIHNSLPVRCLLAVSMVAPLAALLGTFFPMGMRLLGRLSSTATAWMWGVNGATGVLASVFAVAISMWSGISTNFYAALVAYAMLALPATLLWRQGAGARDGDSR